jgi:hypothetical protein
MLQTCKRIHMRASDPDPAFLPPLAPPLKYTGWRYAVCDVAGWHL